MLSDLRHAFRVLTRTRSTMAIAITTIALAVGVNTSIFSAVYALLFRSLPFDEPSRLVYLYGTNLGRGIDRDVTSVPDFVDWRDQNTCFEYVAAVDERAMNLTGVGEPARLGAALVSWSFFDLLRVRPVIGRGFVAGEDEPGAPRVAILGHALWADRFNRDPAIVGRAITLDDQPFTVVGIMGEGFQFPASDVWVPAVFNEPLRSQRGARFLPVIARLRDGVTLDEARQQLDTIARRAEDAYRLGWSATAVPAHDVLAADYRQPAIVLFAAVTFVLLVACANVGSLLLARMTARQRELAIRAALGGTRQRLVRQLLVESMVMALVGAALGVLLATWGVGLLVSTAPVTLPPWFTIELDAPVLLYTLGAATLSGLAFGAGPALFAAQVDLVGDLGSGTRDVSAASGSRRLQDAFIVGEIALALMLLVGAGLMMRSLNALVAAPLGFTTDGVLALDLSLPAARYPQPDQRAAFFGSLSERIRALPGVTDVSAVTNLPLSGNYEDTGGIRISGRPDPPEDQPIVAGRDVVLPGYFATLGIERIGQGGRDFTASDVAGGHLVAIVNEEMARQHWPGENTVGRTFVIGRTRPQTYEVVDVVRNLRRANLGQIERPHFYQPFWQSPRLSMSLVVKSAEPPSSLAPILREAVRAADPLLPVASVRTMVSYAEGAAGIPRFLARIMAVFAVLALVLAAVGVYGVLSYRVVQRRAEIGVRVALGASKRDVLLLVARHGLILILSGLALGTAGALALGQLVRELLYGVEPIDPVTLSAVSVLLLATGLAACAAPVRRATRIDPVEALRD